MCYDRGSVRSEGKGVCVRVCVMGGGVCSEGKGVCVCVCVIRGKCVF